MRAKEMILEKDIKYVAWVGDMIYIATKPTYDYWRWFPCCKFKNPP